MVRINKTAFVLLRRLWRCSKNGRHHHRWVLVYIYRYFY